MFYVKKLPDAEFVIHCRCQCDELKRWMLLAGNPKYWEKMWYWWEARITGRKCVTGGETRITRRKYVTGGQARITGRKYVIPLLLFVLQTPHEPACEVTRSSAVGRRRIIARTVKGKEMKGKERKWIS